MFTAILPSRKTGNNLYGLTTENDQVHLCTYTQRYNQEDDLAIGKVFISYQCKRNKMEHFISNITKLRKTAYPYE